MDILVDRQGLQYLDEQECYDLVSSRPVGRLAVVRGGRPFIVPVNHALDGRDIVFRTAPGTKLDAAQREPGAWAAFEVDDYDPGERTGWSVTIEGRLEPVLDAVTQRRLRRLQVSPWADVADRPHWLRLVVATVSGRRILPRADRRPGGG